MATSVSSVVSHFPSAENGFSTTTSGSVSSGATSVGLSSVTGYTNGEIVALVIDPDDATKKQTFTGTMDTGGSQVTSVVWTAGTNQTHAAGATVVDYATATHISMITKGLLVAHNQSGTHKADMVLTTPKVDTINEETGANGVTIDGLNIKDSKLVTSNSVITANITNAAVTADKLSTGGATDVISTSQTTTSTSFTDLATAGPAVTVTIGANGLALVSFGAEIGNSSAEQRSLMGVTISGASSESASTTSEKIIRHAMTGTSTEFSNQKTYLYTGLTAGSTTFTCKYAVAGNTGTFLRRFISVVPL